MTRWTASVFVWLLLAAVSLAAPRAIITGPKEGATGDLVVLSGAQSQGAGYRWISPEGLQTLQCGSEGREIAFASGTPGRYEFILVVADADALIDYARHTVTIGTPGPGPDPDPEPDPDPQPEPGKYEALRQLSHDSAARLGDKDTAAGLSAAIMAVDATIERACEAGQCPGLDVAQRMMVQGIESRLLVRPPASRGINWLDGWRKPVNDSLKQLNLRTVPEYRAAMRAAAVGLGEAAR